MTPRVASTIQERHLEAMELCDKAESARAKGDHARAKRYFKRAFESEREAAALVATDHTFEPTRSVLHRSAATLAIECGEPRAAEKLIATGLAGDPPDELAEELRNLLEEANFQRHLELRGLELAQDQIQLSIAGNATSHGMAQSDEFLQRVQASEKLIIRTIERKLDKPFRETGRAVKEITNNFELYLSVPRAASFAVTLRVGLRHKQMSLPGIDHDKQVLREPEKIIDEMLECLESFAQGDETRLTQLIPDKIYRRNFKALAERLAPDGDRVKTVGLTTIRQGQPREVTLRRGPSESRNGRKPDENHSIVVGRLSFADATKSNRQRIKVVDDDGVPHPAIVRSGMMVDIVKPLWEDRVQAYLLRRGNRSYLERIEKTDDGVKG
jgi:hypothetical protein